MFNLGFSELLLLGVIALIFIGPKQLPEMARSLGRVLNELKRASTDFQQSFTEPLKDDLKIRLEEARRLNAEDPVAHGPEAITQPLDVLSKTPGADDSGDGGKT